MKSAFPAALLAALVLSACGGGGGSTSASVTTAPASGVSTVSGTVTGFGSIIVDGTRIDDHAVAAGVELEDGTVAPTELKVGQHVDVEHDGNLVATKVRVGTEVEGKVDAVDTAAGSLTVLGQTVLVNTDATLGPVTVFEAPYTQLSDVKAGDLVEIHGVLKTDASGKTTVQATRIEKKTADAYDRVNGIVSDLSTTASTFKLGNLLISYADAKLLPAGIALANGQEVRVSIPAGSASGTTGTTGTTGSTGTTTTTTTTTTATATTTTATAIKAAVIKVRDRKNESQGKEVELGGPVSSPDATAKTFVVNGTKVDASAASFLQPGKSFADLKANTYVVVKGTFGSDQVLKATKIVIRGIDSDKGAETELHGSIVSYVSNADFMVREVHVDASAAKIDLSDCPGTTQLANTVQVEVLGSLTATGTVKASLVKCEPAKDGQSVLARLGVAGKVDVTAKTFTLTTERGTLTVQWASNTLFVRADTSTLEGKQIVVEGVMDGTTFKATKIVLTSK
jgi:cytochrome c-type biogenesis protein CcmE